MMYLIVGLGNPGKRYELTRHNVGFRTIDALAERWGADVSMKKWDAVIGEVRRGTDRILLAKPQTFMNASGKSVAQIMQFYKLEPENLLVLHDDIDIELGHIRIRKKGSAGTHNGLRSVVKELGSDAFGRVKLSVGRRPPFMDLAEFVLSTFEEREKAAIREEIEAAAQAVEQILGEGYDVAMNSYNGWVAPSVPVLSEEEKSQLAAARAVQAAFHPKACGD